MEMIVRVHKPGESTPLGQTVKTGVAYTGVLVGFATNANIAVGIVLRGSLFSVVPIGQLEYVPEGDRAKDKKA